MSKLIIIGANNFQLPLILKAKELGCETHVFAWEEGAVGKAFADYFYPFSITEKERILDKAREIKPDGVISIGSDLAITTVNFLAKELGLTGNSLESTLLSTNKFLMRETLSRQKIPCPRFLLVRKKQNLQLGYLQFPLIVKPTDRSGSRGVSKVISTIELSGSIVRATEESFSGEVIVEEFVEGEEYSIEMISWQGEHHFLQITEKETSGAPFFVEKSHHQPADIKNSTLEEIISIVKKSLTALEIQNGASHSEIIITKKGKIYITEIGARMGGDYIGSDLVQLSTGFDFLKAVIDISLGFFNGVGKKENHFSGIYYVFPDPGKVIKIKDKSSSVPEIVRSEIYCKTGDRITQIKESNQRPACYIYRSKNGRFVAREEIISIETEKL